VAGGVAVDLASKTLLWSYLAGPPDAGGRTVDFLPGFLRLVASRNPGIVFGMNPADWFSLGAGAGQVLTAVLTVLTAGLILYVFADSPRSRGWTHVWCALILAGALGNLYDRLVYGYVRDVFQFTLTVGGKAVWPFVFNAADVFLVFGVAMLALAILRSPRPDAAAEAHAEAPARERG